MALESDLSRAETFTVRQEQILIVDDEEFIRETVAQALMDEGYRVMTAADGQKAVDILCLADTDSQPQHKIDLAIIDLMLPGINGLDICRMVRHQHLDLPILVLSARGNELDRVVGLELGADDYLAKPFGMRELIARCRALLRRHNWSQRQPVLAVLTYADITLNLKEFWVTVAGQEVSLSPKEFRMLEVFMQTPHRVWTREDLIREVWGPDFMGDRKTVDVHIRWLREKIEHDPGNPRYIKTLRGFGYRFG